MAELPDLTVFANVLTRKYHGLVLDRLEVTVDRKINVSAKKLKSGLEGQVLDRVTRAGKTLEFYFSGNQVLG